MNARMRVGALRRVDLGDVNARQVRNALHWLLRQSSVQSLPGHGNTSWRPLELISLALLWIWSCAPRLTDAFEEAREQAEGLFGCAALTTYQGLAGALRRWTATWIPLLQQRIHDLAEGIGGCHLRIGRWCAIAVDGSRSSTPRTISNERAFCAPTYGHGQTAKHRRKKTKGMRRRKNERSPAAPQGPQVWITLMWHIRLGLPWCWKLGPSNASEREHMRELLASGHFLKNTLFIGDAGFIGYDLWRAILTKKHHFLVRVGSNVHLLRKLDIELRVRCNDRVWCWPTTARRQRPLELRLVNVKLGGKKAWLLTSVLDERQLTKQEMLDLYRLRWGVEVQFRGLKQTFERRRLRSRNCQRALNELEWILLGLTVVQLFALRQQLAMPDANPQRLSVAAAVRAVRRALRRLHRSAPTAPTWNISLRRAVLDRYRRCGPKHARYRPRNPDMRGCGRPNIRNANSDERKQLHRLRHKILKRAA